MNKVLMVILILGAGALVLYVVGGNKSTLPPGTDIPGDVNVEDVEQGLKETNARKVYGSCNAVAEKSTCIDYVGSAWYDNNMAELNCQEVGTFSKNTCPYPDFGGCQTSGGTVLEIVAWFYKDGPGEFTEESIPYAQMACNSTPNSAWVTPESFLR